MMVNFENHILKYFLLWLGCWSSSFILTTTLVTQDLSSERTSLGNWSLCWKIPAQILWWRKLLSVWKDRHKTLKCTGIRTFFREVRVIHTALKITEIKIRSPGSSTWLLTTLYYLSSIFSHIIYLPHSLHICSKSPTGNVVLELKNEVGANILAFCLSIW